MHDAVAHPVSRTFRTPGVLILAALVAIGFAIAMYRFVFGLQPVTHLDQQHPWGLWIAVDVASGVALAAGGFTTAALVHVFHREHFHAIARPALLTAMLGYTFVGIGLMVDLGRYYNIWHPIVPSMWQGNSVLFEVGLCVMAYLTVLYVEFSPIVLERLAGQNRSPRLAQWSRATLPWFERVMFLFIIAGVVISCLHQSSLGNLMVIAPSKMHALWYTPILALLFLLSAISVGFPMVICESLTASWAFKLKPEMEVLGALARLVPIILGIYFSAKLADMAIRESYVHLAENSVQSWMFLAEMGLGVALPLVLFSLEWVRRSPRALFTAALLAVLGVALNRINVFLVAYDPPYATRSYFPSLGEVFVTLGLISLLILVYRVCVTYLPVISHPVHVKGVS